MDDIVYSTHNAIARRTEAAMLGMLTLLANGDCAQGSTETNAIADVMARIQPKHFIMQQHSVIYEAMCECVNAGDTPDYTILANVLTRREKLKYVGGVSYLTSLIDGIPKTTHIMRHVDMMLDLYQRRQLAETGESMAEGAVSGLPLSDVVGGTRNAIDAVSLDDELEQSSAAEVVDKFTQHMDDVKAGRVQSGISTGIPRLDKLTGGVHLGDMTIVAARPGVGKTALAIGLAVKAAKDGRTVLYMSLEMPARQMALRMMAMEAGIPMPVMMQAAMNENQWERYFQALAQVSSWSMLVDTRGQVTVVEVQAEARKHARKNKLDMLIIDHVGYMDAPEAESATEAMTQISRGLKVIAKEFDVAVVALCQLNRSVEQRGVHARPRLSDLRQSGALEQDAATVLFIQREESSDEAMLYVAKQRNGPTAVVEMLFDAEAAKFSERSIHRSDDDCPW